MMEKRMIKWNGATITRPIQFVWTAIKHIL